MRTKDVKVVIPEMLTNGSTLTTSLMRLAPSTRPEDVRKARLVTKCNCARTALQDKDAGLKRELRFTVLMNMPKFLVKRP